MHKYNYSHSSYMLPNESHTIEEMSENHDYARFLHYADILRYQMDELEAAGKLDQMLHMRCLMALQDSQYTGVFIKPEYFRAHMERMIEALPVYEAPKTLRSTLAAFFQSL